METLTGEEIKVCSRCNNSAKPQQDCCAICGASDFSQGQSKLFVDSRAAKKSFIKLAVYLTSAVAFLLGIAEGFLDNNSGAMTLDLIVSLIVLSLTPRANENPVSTLAFCIFFAFALPLSLPLLDLFPVEGWMAIRLLLLFIPLAALIVYAGSKRG